MHSRLAVLLASLLLLPPAGAQKPAVLFQTRHEASHGGEVDYAYLRELHQRGFEVDYLDFHRDFNWDRIRKFNCLVLQFCPASEAEMGKDWMRISKPPFKAEFLELVDRYLDAGGGILVMAYVVNRQMQLVADMLARWGAQIPMELIVDPDHARAMTRMPRVKLAFTDQVLPSPVSEGVKQFWYPYSERPHYNAGNSNPLALSAEWQVVARASKDARTQPIDLNQTSMPGPPGILVRPQGVAQPPLFAIRRFGNGRLALTSQYPQFSWGQGTRWLYNREVLTRGLQGKPSHFQRLLDNTYRWLSEPSLRGGEVGGFVTDPDRLQPPNQRPGAQQKLEEIFWGEDEEKLHRPPRGKLYRGLIGVQTELGDGRGAVADYARAARDLKLDFLVLMDDFRALTPAKLEQMKRQCAALSDDSLRLFPGYTIDNNIGNHLFIFGEDPVWPDKRVLTGPNLSQLNQQYRLPDGTYPRPGLTVVLNWILYTVKRNACQVGFYDFAHSGRGMRMKDLRTYGMAAVRFYRDGELVEDVTDDYLLTAQGTVPPAPASVNLVRSPAALRAAVQQGQALMYGQARSLDTLYQDALRYTGQYDGLNVFLSDGPRILQWPACYRVHTFAKESFVTGRNVMVSPIDIQSEVGLRSVTIYNGRDLFRRFLLHGEKELHETLLLNATVHKNLVLIAEDVRGGKAVSFARRCWKVGHGLAFCGDRVNDCGDMLLSHGAGKMRVTYSPRIDGGRTWDGGPKGETPLVDFQVSTPVLTTASGEREGHRPYNQTPLLEFTDEGARVVRDLKTEIFPDEVPVIHSWLTYGPLLPSRWMNLKQTYAEWHTPTVHVLPAGHAGYGIEHGAKPCLYTCDITFKQATPIRQLQWLRDPHYAVGHDVHVAIHDAEGLHDIAAEAVDKPTGFTLRPGDWFGVFSRHATNSHLFINRTPGGRLQLVKAPHPVWLSLRSSLEGGVVNPGDHARFELFSLGYPVDIEVDEPADLQRAADYLAHPPGLEILQGQRVDSAGVIELAPDRYLAEIRMPRPKVRTDIVLPFRLHGLNRRWTAGLFMRSGYVQGHYGTGKDRYRPLGIDLDGRVYVPAYPDLAEETHLIFGHPLIADDGGRELFIQVTQTAGGTGGKPHRWWVAVNNPTDQPVTTTLTSRMNLPNFPFATRELTIQPGEHIVLSATE